MPSGRPIIVNDLTNKIVNEFTVIEFDENNKKWKCKCSCGNIRFYRYSTLNLNQIISCGCKNKGKQLDRLLENNLAIKKAVFKSYKSSAIRKNLDFNLSFEQLISIIEMNCFYCGNETSINSNKCHIQNYNNYTHNGIDRQNNSIGYVKGNVVPCCPICNFAKRTMSVNQFKNWIIKINSHLTKTNWNESIAI